MYAIFCCQKNKIRSVDPPCLDPLDYGLAGEPEPQLLLRRGRVALFATREQAEKALAKTGKEMEGGFKQFSFLILECREVKHHGPHT